MSRKVYQRFLKLMFAVMLALGLMTHTYYASDGSAKITITKGEDVEADLSNMSVKAYMVLDQINADETDISKKQYAVATGFETFFNIDEIKSSFTDGKGSVTLTYDEAAGKLKIGALGAAGISVSNAKLDATYPAADLLSRVSSGTDIATFYTWVDKYIAKNEATLSPKATATASATEAVLDQLDEGYYALTFSNVPNGVLVKQGILIATAGDTASMTLKAEPLTVDKTVSKNGTDFADEISAAMDTVLTYKIVTKVPTLTDFSKLTNFNFEDTMTHQKLKADSFTLKIGTQTFTFENNQFKNGQTVIASVNSTETTFTVDFVESALKDYHGQTIELKYQAQLTSDAIDINNNDITLNYTNGPDSGILTDRTTVYTYGIDVTKKFSDDRVSDPAVRFALYPDEEGSQGTTPIALVGTAGAYHLPASGETGSVTSLEIDQTDGTLAITGLDTGTYWLVETATPDGFTKASPIKITLVGNQSKLDEGQTTVSAGQLSFDNIGGHIALAKFDVLNQKGFSLPVTGGAGTMMITIGGMALIVAAAGLYIVSKKKKA